MKCPIMTAGRMTCDDPLDFTYVDCLKEECAWWDATAGGCSIYLISRSLMGLVDTAIDIKEKMPHAGQFTK